MYIKIYFNDKPLFLCDDIDTTIEPWMHHDDAVFIDELNTHTVKAMIHEMQIEKVHAGIFYHSNMEALKKAFWKKFTIIKAGGGIVENKNKEILMIYRRGFWDLPKGKHDKGETIQECALREVQEETGLKNVTVTKEATITYHTYHEGTKYILKESHWFYMKVISDEELIPQTEEDITEIKWVNKKEIPGLLKKSFASIRDLLSGIK